MGEFELIRRYFERRASASAANPVVALGIGDDCALLSPRPGTQLAVSTDLLVQGTHFFADVCPNALGHKALAVNLSDLAAMGARPLGFTLALALPAVDEAWLEQFSAGLFALADAHQCTLIGGDTTRGPLTICITVWGEIPVADGEPGALRRSGAQAGDDVFVSGHLGEARLALLALQGQLNLPDALLQSARLRLERPTPRVELGLALRGIATSAIDLSDGLAGDLGHIMNSSGLGSTLETEYILNTIDIKYRAENAFNLSTISNNKNYDSEKYLLSLILTGGDDYELAFTAPPQQREAVLRAAAAANTPVTRVGRMDATSGLRLADPAGQVVDFQAASFDHFRAHS